MHPAVNTEPRDMLALLDKSPKKVIIDIKKDHRRDIMTAKSDLAASPQCNIIFQEGPLRISAVSPRIIRIEKRAFTDLPTQTVWYRDHGIVPFHWETTGKTGHLTTDEVSFLIDIRKGTVISAKLSDGTVIRDFSKGILPGTARTLDMANGAVKLEKGILSRSGGSMLDDSTSLILNGDDILPRPKCSDIYYFAFGSDNFRLLKAFYQLTGPVPLIPKFALGNWWSRYKAYTQEEYIGLMQTFIDRKVPITVATIDMDWHWVDVKDRFGKVADPGKPRTVQEIMYNTLLPGWTGYSWNKELFPDRAELFRWLHAHGFRVPLNVHPSQGIRAFEDCYEAFCARMGKDPTLRERIPFDITDEKFREAYFEDAHRPLENEGVDFWWIDWQQGRITDIPGLDPLWALNHYHSKDMEKQGKRPLILSRYAGLGSHRYPLGFSGDSFCTWKSLAFQPYFTSTASNAGYSWWSHDIGGHQQGIQDDELYLRWLQFGVFSPVNRLHSSNSDFMGKEPWHRSYAVCQIAEEFLRLRHKLIPYLYSANYATHTEGIPLCMPMHYLYDDAEAWRAKDQYLFGQQLLVCPITKPSDRKLNLARADVWLPDGRWTDIFTGRSYSGGGWVPMYRDLDSIPVLAKEGAIVPMYRDGRSNALSADQPLDIHVWRGNGHFELYEDDCETMDYACGKFTVTRFDVHEEGKDLLFTVTPPADTFGLIPDERKLWIIFRDIKDASSDANGSDTENYGCYCIEVNVSDAPVTVRLSDIRPICNAEKDVLRTSLLTRYQGRNFMKNILFKRESTLPRRLGKAMKEFDHLL